MPVFNWTILFSVYFLPVKHFGGPLCVYRCHRNNFTFACVDAFSLMSKCRALLSLANHVLLHRCYVPA